MDATAPASPDRPGFWRSVVSAWAWFGMCSSLALWFPTVTLVFLATALFDRGRYVTGFWFRRVGLAMTAANPFWSFRCSGERVKDPRRPYVVVANHESFADIILISRLPWEMKWLSKVELLRIPVLGWMMWMAGDVPVQRRSRTSGAEALAICRQRLARRVSVMIFPEGTRSATGELLPFKDGAFRLAIETGVPILPLAVAGTGSALPKHDWRFNRSVAEVRVLPPVETAGLTLDDLADLKRRVRETIQAARDDLRRSLA